MFLDRLQERRREAELMDQPGLDPAEHVRALRGLRRINRLSGSDRLLWGPIHRLAAREPGRSWRVLDLATGGGDVLVGLGRRAARGGVALDLHGCDVSDTALERARAGARAAGVAATFFRLDVLRDPWPDGFEVLTCSLFLHHLDSAEAVAMLARMKEKARRLVLVNDLVRSRTGYLMARVGTHLVSRSPVVHTDGPLSVAAAFTPDEALALANAAGMTGATLTRHWPARFLLCWEKPHSEGTAR